MTATSDSEMEPLVGLGFGRFVVSDLRVRERRAGAAVWATEAAAVLASIRIDA